MNLLIVLFDQLQAASMSTYGGLAATPNWDRLVDPGGPGARFDRACCASPLCVPSRGSIFTGLYPHAHGQTSFGEGYDAIRPGTTLLTERILEGGYAVAYSGAWHVNPPDAGHTDRFDLFEPGGFPYEQHGRMLAEQGGDPSTTTAPVRTFTDAGKPTDWTFSVPVPACWTDPPNDHPDMQNALTTARWLQSAPSDRPFVAGCSLFGPHPPLICPEPYYSRHKAEDMVPPPGFGAIPDNEPAGVAESAPRQCIADWTWERFAPGAAAYLGYVEFVDACLGVVLDALEASGRADDTLIIATADHGEMLGAHHLYQKEMPYEPSARVPLAIAGPGVAPGVRRQLAAGVDLAPTIVEMLGLDAMPGHGQSLAAILRDPGAPGQDAILCTFDGEIEGGCHWRALITDTHKYVRYDNGAEQLFDLKNDPDEMNSLADASMLQAMRSILRNQLSHIGDPFVNEMG